MSGYPFGYPFQGGQPPPQQQYPPPFQPYGSYPPPPSGFGTTPLQPQQPPHYPPPSTSYHANAQSAYDYNASSIPGLGTPTNAAPASTLYNGAWNQGAYGNGGLQAQYPAYTPAVPNASAPIAFPYPQVPAVPQNHHQPLPAQHAPPTTQSSLATKPQPRPQPAVQPKPMSSTTDIQEDGEIDDGYFDDLYDDASKAPSIANESAPLPGKASGNAAQDGSDQEPNFYDTDKEDVSANKNLPATTVVKMKAGPQVQSRERSRASSPRLSTTEPRPRDAAISNGKAGSKPTHRSTAAAAPVSTSTPVQLEGSQAQGKTAPPVMAHVKAGPVAPKALASVAEAMNEAKKAILKLLPYGVKYQNYIDEGIEANLVQELFAQLNMPTGPAVATTPSETPIAAKGKADQALESKPPKPTEADTVAQNQEQRKDRIARLMAVKQAERKAKLAAASTTSLASSKPEVATAPTNNGVSAATASAPLVKPAPTRAEKDVLLQQKVDALRVKAEKDLLLQQKVEALRAKARESKKLAQKPASPQVPTPTALQRPQALQLPAVTTSSSLVAAKSGAGTSLSSTSKSAAASPIVPTLPSFSRAGVQINPRKRPVAADFMDSPAQGAKRPSLADRGNSSFIISVSDDEDDEDDDDDVEMEVESATEDSPAPFQQPFTLAKRAIRDYPPLKDFTTVRPMASPVAGTSSSGNKTPNMDLQSKEKAIMEMNRRIKELEAKKQAKIRSGNVTPRSPPSAGDSTPIEQVAKPDPPRPEILSLEQALKTPLRGTLRCSDVDDKTTPSAQLLQEAEAASMPISLPMSAVLNRQAEDKRVARSPSAQDSSKAAKALAKAERMRQLQEEMQRLQAESDQDDDDDSVEEQHNGKGSAAHTEADATDAAQDMLETMPHESSIAEPTNAAEAPGEAGEEASGQHPPDTTSQNQPMDIDSSAASESGIIDEASTGALPLLDHGAGHTSVVVVDVDEPSTSHTRSQGEEPVVDTLDELDGYEPPEPAIDADVGARSPTSAPKSTEAVYLAQQSDEKLAETASREITDGAGLARQTSFAPYESPLRFYHAYRFHPQYNDDIGGGLKSMTFSNKIDPNKEMCPDEWEGKDCPRGTACQFQHFQSIVAPDSEIILELGSSEEFSGEQKKEFNNGLREVVVSFQKSKVRDFRTIAGAIVEFRRRFLGDPSKVLRLGGVST